VITDESIEQVREGADIVQIIGEFVNLKRTGTDFRGPCPFHQGKHRNFSVSPRKKIYYCFVCHEGGDVFHFLQKKLGVPSPDAVKLAAEKSGIQVHEVDTHREGPDAREPLWEINATASSYFQKMLWDDEAALPARAYLEKRGIDRETANRFSLGYAPRDRALLRQHLNSLGFDDDRIVAAGLFVKPEEAPEELRPRFRDRLMIPIFDALGRGVGFGGRVLDDREPKYLNSPETAIFGKGKLLYALNWAKNSIRKDERVIVVEGFFDVIRMMAAGVESVVAPMGTALTDAQAGLLKKYTRNAFLLYDSDQAGLKATFRSGDELLSQGMTVSVVTLPDGDDPDSFVAKHGAEGLEAQLAQAIDVFERKIQILERAGWLSGLQKKRRALDRLLPTIRATAEPVMRDLYLSRAAEAVSVDKAVLLRELANTRRERPAIAPIEPGPVRVVEDRRVRTRRVRYTARGASAERELVRSMLHRRPAVESVAERLGPESFRDPDFREIYEVLLRLGEEADVMQVAEALSDDAAGTMRGLLEDPLAGEMQETPIDDCIAVLRAREIEERLAEIDRESPLASDAQKDEMFKERSVLMKELTELGGKSFKAFRQSRKR
jgi:DNA primase